jgi:diguanylate cyclase (GGDEF)-like protein
MESRRGWLSHQLSEFLAVVSSYPNEAAAIEGGVDRLAEAVEAEVAAVMLDGRLAASVGFRPGQEPHDELAAIAIGTSEVSVTGVGDAFALVIVLDDDERDARVVLLRVGAPFSQEESILLRGMARVLVLTVRLLRLLELERVSRRSLQERQELLERLFRIQRSISHRAPITEVLSAITEGASSLLDVEVVSLRILDEDDPGYLRMAASVGVDAETMASIARRPVGEGVGGRAVAEGRLVVADDYETSENALPTFVDSGLQTAMAAPVYRDGKVAGSLLVASYASNRSYSVTEQEMLLAFAEHTSLALNDSSAIDAINRAYTDAMHRANHDELTGLPNRALVLDRLGHALARRRSSGDDQQLCVLFVDLDRFKAINDSLGHSVGDDVLTLVADRLQAAVRPADTVARLSGDEFVVVCEDITADEAMLVAGRVEASIAEPISLFGRESVLTASVGLAMAQANDVRAEDILRDADVAMYRAKEQGGARIEVFDERIRSQMLARIEMEHALRRALSSDELRLHYQPVVGAESGKLVALEALVRWEHPDDGLLPPDTFVPLAEQSGLIVALGHWVIEEACRQLAAWRALGPDSPFADVRVDINLSGRQFADTGLLATICNAMRRHGLPGHAVGFEITESVLMDDGDSTVAVLRGLKELGVHLAIDDFGTGYSSLSYLESFPVDTVKIDRSFVQRMSSSGTNDVIISAVVSLARALGLDVIAEGVETSEQLEQVRSLGCQYVQGYFFGRPAPADQLSVAGFAITV